MVKKSKRWDIAQDSEKKCWEDNEKKLRSKEYQRSKINYWNRVLNKTKKYIDLDESASFLDSGCGPSGLVLKYPKKSNLVCLDPLMKDYLNSYSYLKDYDAKYISGKIEEFSSKEKFEYIFNFNCIDHVDSIPLTLRKIYSLLNKEGVLVLSVNCHNYKLIQKLLLKFSFILDRPHPHQYSLKQYINFLEKEVFKVIKSVNIDNDNSEFYASKNKKQEKKKLSWKSIVRKLFHPFTFMHLTGIKLFGKENEKTIYSTYLIMAKK